MDQYVIKIRENQTQQTPAALVLSFSPLAVSTVRSSIGYMFLAHSRSMIVSGSRKETLFWDFCQPCYRYKQKTCSGGLKTLTANLRNVSPSHSFIDGRGTNRTHYYTPEICTPYAGSAELTRALQDPDPIQVPLPDHVFMIWSSQDYIFSTKGVSGGFQFAPLRLFNTSSDGSICTGTTQTEASRDRSLSARVERFMNGRKNTDLTPKPSRMSLVDWVRNYDPESLALDPDQRDWAAWRDSFTPYDTSNNEKRLFLADLYSKVAFLHINYENIPNEGMKAKVRDITGLTSIRRTTPIVLPFLKKTGTNEVICALDVTEAVDISDYPELDGVFDHAI